MAAIELAEKRSMAPVGKVFAPQPLRTWSQRSFKGASPETLSGVLTKADRGDLEDWAEFADHMLQLDPIVRSKYEERALHIVGSEIEVTPGRGRPGQEGLAEDAARFFRQELQQARDLESTLMGLLHAEGLGWAGAQHDWRRVHGEWHSQPDVIDARDIGFTTQHKTRIRTYKSDSALATVGEWLEVDDLEDGRFIFHVPRKVAGRPHQAGDLRPIAWHFIFKKWAILYMQEGLEKHGNPWIAGFIPDNTPADVAASWEDGIAKFTQSQAVLFRMEDGATNLQERLQLIEPQEQSGEAWREALKWYDAQITKGLLGSELNTEVGSTGGNRALGESQFDATILPRLMAMAKRLAGTLELYWAKPLLRFNAHVFGGQVPPTPQVKFKLVADEPPEIPPEAIEAGLNVSQDEFGASFGLEPGGVRGGAIVRPVAKSQAAATGGAAPDVPFPQSRKGRQLTLPLTQTRTSATSSASTTRAGHVPFGE